MFNPQMTEGRKLEAGNTNRRFTFGRRRIVPRATVVASKRHNQTFLVKTLDELGFVASECANPAQPDAITYTAPDLLVIAISGGDGIEISGGGDHAPAFQLEVSAGNCSDGMSDKQYELKSTFRYGDGQRITDYKGCGEAVR